MAIDGFHSVPSGGHLYSFVMIHVPEHNSGMDKIFYCFLIIADFYWKTGTGMKYE